jgi:S1-C subfamily serine protease
MEPNARPFPDEEMNPFMRRPWLGVQLEPGDAGPRVAAVMPMSPAQRHGLRVGDILTKVGGKDVRAAEDVTKEIEQHKPGERVSLTLQRGNEQIVAEVELGLQPGRPGAPLNVFRMPGEQRSYLGIEAKDAQDGLKITKVFEGSPADKAGLKCDDVILRVDDRDVAGLNDLRAIVRAHKPDDEITIAVKRLDRELDVKVKLGRIGDANWNALP